MQPVRLHGLPASESSKSQHVIFVPDSRTQVFFFLTEHTKTTIKNK